MKLRRWFLGAALLTLGACGARGPMLHELGPDALYTRGKQMMHEEEWSEAIRALEQLVSRFPTDPRIEEVRLQLGKAYFGKEEYITAAAEFDRLVNDFPTGRWADEARFRTCESYYNLSPKPQLDQEYTQAAIRHCQALVTYYPQSPYAAKARELVDSLHAKLAQKAYLNGEYYFKRQAYESSIIYYEDLLERYPESEFAPKALLRLTQVYQKLGYEEELEATKARLLRDFPDTAEAEQARGITLADGR